MLLFYIHSSPNQFWVAIKKGCELFVDVMGTRHQGSLIGIFFTLLVHYKGF